MIVVYIVGYLVISFCLTALFARHRMRQWEELGASITPGAFILGWIAMPLWLSVLIATTIWKFLVDKPLTRLIDELKSGD